MAAMTEVRVPDIGDFERRPGHRGARRRRRHRRRRGPADRARVGQGDHGGPLAGRRRGGRAGRSSVGDEVSQGDLILTLAERGRRRRRRGARPRSRGAPRPTRSPRTTRAASPTPASTPTPPGAGREEHEARRRGRRRRREPDGEPDRPAGTFDGDDVYAGPGARRLARQLGVDLGAVAGSGPKGRITKEDVSAAAESGAARRPRRPPPPRPPRPRRACRPGPRSTSPSSARSRWSSCRASSASRGRPWRATGR